MNEASAAAKLSKVIHEGFTPESFGRWLISDLSSSADRMCEELFDAGVFGAFKHVEIKRGATSALPMYKFARTINADELKRFTALVQYARASEALLRIEE